MKNSIAAFIVICGLAFTSYGQNGSTGVLSGTIKDSRGDRVSGVEISLLNSFQLVVKTARSDESGAFRISDVAPGTYLLRASRSDFGDVQRPVTVTTGKESFVELTFEISTLTEEVTVSAETGTVESRSKVPQQINIVGEEVLDQRVTAVLAQAAQEEVGISMQRTSPTIGAVLVRGLTEVGVYVDGVRFTNSTQRGGINTFFNLNEPTALRSIEVQRSPNTAQYGSDGLGGNVQLLSRQPEYGFEANRFSGEFSTSFNYADTSFGGNLTLSYGRRNFGVLTNFAARRINTLRPGGGIDSHSAITRFLGLPSDFNGDSRLPDTAFTQYGGTMVVNYSPTERDQLSFRYQRSQQDGGKRYDQLLGGDGNLIANLRNLMLDFGYVRYSRQSLGFFDSFSANVSYNSQREERVNQGGQGNPFASISNDKERTTSIGTSFFLDKIWRRNSFLIGGDYYFDKVSAPSFSTNPVSGGVTLTRPRVPNGAIYRLGGVYLQDVFEAIPERLRISGAVRYNIASYRSRAENAPVVNGIPLFPNDSMRVSDVSGRIGSVLQITGNFNAAINYSRGFRAPNITNLGSLGLVGVGFQVATADVANLNATIGSTADASAVSTGTQVTPLRSETSNNFDVSFRYSGRKFSAGATGFVIDYGNTIVRQTLILPQGAVGTTLGSQTIVSQNANGAVFVPLSTAPVLVQANFGSVRLQGIELEFESKIKSDWTLAGNYSYLYAEDKLTGEVPNLGGGGLPPQFGVLRLRYQPSNRYWIEAYGNFAGRQTRLSSLDLSDRRAGAARSRSQIANFFRRGACVRGFTTPGTSGSCGSSGGILLATGETLAQLQNRLLPLGRIINGVLIENDSSSAPMFAAIPGYFLANIRSGFSLSDSHEFNLSFTNILDKSHRMSGWGIDGPGRSVLLQYRYKF